MKKHLFALTILSVAVITGCKKNADQAAATNDLIPAKEVAYNVTDRFVPNQLIVKFKSGVSEKSKTQTLEFINGKVDIHIVTNAMKDVGDNEGIYVVNTNQDVFSAMARMKGESNVEYAEPNWIYTHATTSNDTYFTNGNLWGMYGPSTSPANQYGSQAASAWAAGHTGASSATTVYVGVIDEGAMYFHEDLSGNFGNPAEIPGNGQDDDNNGKVDDTYGWDFDANDNTTYDGTGDDHGTHVSGTIAGIGGNGKGVAGMIWSNVKLISAKFLGANGGTTANAIAAVDYITNLKTLDKLNIVATNNSWGGGGFSQALQDAIERANQKGILFIAAAGNGNQAGRAINIDSKPSYPASYPNDNIITVAAINSTGGIASWSNYGATSVDLGAPGVGIYSSLPASGNTFTYGSYSGTSMATPHVTGAAALYASTNNLHPALAVDAAVIKKAILDAAKATPTASLAGKTVTGGRLNVSGF